MRDTLPAGTLYPFERFTADAKKTLTLAQEEAQRSHHSYIGTEHLLLGILRGDGPGHQALVELGVELGAVREAIEMAVGRNERIIIQQVIPTSRVKKVIEIAFEQARRMGRNYVNSGHLLMGLVIEGEGLASHVLDDVGADRKSVVSTVERLMGSSAVEEGDEPPPAGDLDRVMHHPRIENFKRSKGVVDMKGLVERLAQPPEQVVSLREQLDQVREQQRELRRRLEQAEDDWLREITE